MKRTVIAGLAGLVIVGGLAEAKVYRWVDENGKVVYSQTPPPASIQAEEVKVKAPPPATAPEKTTNQENAETTEEEKGNPALDAGLRKEYCEKSRTILKALEEAGPDTVFVTEDNKSIKLDSREKAKKIKEAQAAIKAYCD